MTTSEDLGQRNETYHEKRVLWKSEDAAAYGATQWEWDGIIWSESEFDRLEKYLTDFQTPCELCDLKGEVDSECPVCHGEGVEKLRDYKIEIRQVKMTVSYWRPSITKKK